MKLKKKCLFLGYGVNKTTLIKFLKSKKINVVSLKNRSLNLKLVKKFDFIISFGYRKIISKGLIERLDRPIINLHISYLPYNRGAYSNFWSFINNTPKGVTIHEIDNGIDTGKIIYRKKINFTIDKETTFRSTYKILILEIEKLFKKNYKSLINRDYTPKKQSKLIKLNLKSDLKRIPNWDQSIKNFISTYKT
tara:strand:+ start:8508 stop:9086 length:579 start_codon:yes stop_codon:yes gene_type:complete